MSTALIVCGIVCGGVAYMAIAGMLSYLLFAHTEFGRDDCRFLGAIWPLLGPVYLGYQLLSCPWRLAYRGMLRWEARRAAKGLPKARVYRG